MKLNILKSILTILLLSISVYSYSLENSEMGDADSALSNNKDEEEQWGIAGFPLPFYSPETKMGLGVGFIIYHKPDPSNDELRPDEFEFNGIGTQEKQLESLLNVKLYLHGNDILLSGKLKARRWPDEFCGIGPDTSEKNNEKLSQNSYSIEPNFQYQLFKDVFFGPSFSLAKHDMIKRETDGQLIKDIIPGSDGAIVSGAGLKAGIDKADSPFYPKSGYKSDLRVLSYNRSIGSEYNFFQVEIDHRQFFQVTENQILALQGLMIFSGGDVPFQMMPQIGGMMMLRGYKQDLYRDKQFMAAQAEYRFPIWWRFGGAVFAGAGEVADNVKDFNLKYIRSTYGAGLRLLVDKKEHINLRLDFGITDQLDGNVYVSLLESF